jgi:tetratricopeptide (TPR) repeat protein
MMTLFSICWTTIETPSAQSANSQPWEFIVVTDPKIKEQLFRLCREELDDYNFWMEQMRVEDLRHPAFQLPGDPDDQLRELKARPADTTAQHRLAVVLELQGRLDEALSWLRQVLKSRPDFAQARYLFGKILLAQGAAEPALEQLEAAARVAPSDANIHYQLGRAYQSLGRGEAARKEFEVFQALKDQRPGPS